MKRRRVLTTVGVIVLIGALALLTSMLWPALLARRSTTPFATPAELQKFAAWALDATGLEYGRAWHDRYPPKFISASEYAALPALERDFFVDFAREAATWGRMVHASTWSAGAEWLRPAARGKADRVWTWTGHATGGFLTLPPIGAGGSSIAGLSLSEADLRTAFMKVRDGRATPEEAALVECLYMARETLQGGGVLELPGCHIGYGLMGDRLGTLLSTILVDVRIRLYRTEVKFKHSLQVTPDLEGPEVMEYHLTEPLPNPKR